MRRKGALFAADRVRHLMHGSVPATRLPAYQRQFIEWIRGDDGHFRPHLPQMTRQTAHLSLTFLGLNPALRIWVRTNEICVDVIWENQWFDRLVEFEMLPRREGGAFICELCEQPVDGLPRRRFRTVAQMRVDHLYAEFSTWCSKSLFPARYIEMQTFSVGAKAARLVTDLQAGHGLNDAGANLKDVSVHWVPVWLPGSPPEL